MKVLNPERRFHAEPGGVIRVHSFFDSALHISSQTLSFDMTIISVDFNVSLHDLTKMACTFYRGIWTQNCQNRS